MTTTIVATALLEFLLSLVLAIGVTYGSFRWFDRMTRDIDEIAELKANNMSVGMVLSGMLLSSALIVKTSIYPAVSTIQGELLGGTSAWGLVKSGAMTIGYIVLSIFLAVVTVYFAMNVFLRLTKDLDEMQEIKSNNTAVAITLSVVLVIMGMFLSDGIGSVMRAMIPVPSIESIEVMD